MPDLGPIDNETIQALMEEGTNLAVGKVRPMKPSEFYELLCDIAELDENEQLEEPAGPLHTPRHDIQPPTSCGPIAMAAVTGEPISAIHNAIYRGSDYNANPLSGITNTNMLAAMKLLGFYVVEERSSNGVRYTLDRFANEHGRDGPFIVALTRHFVAISESEFCDTSTKQPLRPL